MPLSAGKPPPSRELTHEHGTIMTRRIAEGAQSGLDAGSACSQTQDAAIDSRVGFSSGRSPSQRRAADNSSFSST